MENFIQSSKGELFFTTRFFHIFSLTLCREGDGFESGQVISKDVKNGFTPVRSAKQIVRALGNSLAQTRRISLPFEVRISRQRSYNQRLFLSEASWTI